MTRLVLFDIDGTLVLTGGAGARAMTQAFADVFRSAHTEPAASGLAGVPMAGRTDTWIVGEMSRIYGVSTSAASLQRFHDVYTAHLTREIQQPGPRKGVLPGVQAVLDALALREEPRVALLTGNFAAGARIKLEYFDLWRYFLCGAFAEDASDRNGLFEHALARVEACGGPPIQPSEAVIVGDTPFDIGVAIAAGARSVGVATGSYDREALRASGADATLDDLTDLDATLAALGL